MNHVGRRLGAANVPTDFASSALWPRQQQANWNPIATFSLSPRDCCRARAELGVRLDPHWSDDTLIEKLSHSSGALCRLLIEFLLYNLSPRAELGVNWPTSSANDVVSGGQVQLARRNILRTQLFDFKVAKKE